MSDLLILSPPLHSPAEPPAGAFILSSALKAKGIPILFFDCSIDYFYYLLNKSPYRCQNAWKKLKKNEFYTSHSYKSLTGIIHKELNFLIKEFPNWNISLSNIRYSPLAPQKLYDYYDYIQRNKTPFTDYIENKIIPYIIQGNFNRIALSLTFINQLYFCLELACRLNFIGIKPLIGGTLLKSIHKITKNHLPLFSELFGGMETKEQPLLYENEKELLSSLEFPDSVVPFNRYLAPFPVIPLLSSKQCYYHQCEFCPDKNEPYFPLPPNMIIRFMKDLKNKYNEDVLFHFIDSSIPPSFLYSILSSDISRSQFYGFLRFEDVFKEELFWKRISEKGLQMAQWGFESASDRILRLYNKGSNHLLMKLILKYSANWGIKNYLYCLLGLPLEENDDRKMTLDFLAENSSLYDFLNLSIFNLPNDKRILENKKIWNIKIEKLPSYEGDFQFYLPWSDRRRNIRQEARMFIQNQLKINQVIKQKMNNVPNPLKSDHACFFRD